jgi:hypothetical protein
MKQIENRVSIIEDQVKKSDQSEKDKEKILR